MADIFDRLLDKFTSGSQERRTKQVALSALASLILCLAAAIYLGSYKLEFKIRAEGRVLSLDQSNCPEIRLYINDSYFGKVRPGQDVIIENETSGLRHEGFYIYGVEETDSPTLDYFTATVLCKGPPPADHGLKPASKVKAIIIYERKNVGDVLLKKEI